MLVSLNNQQTTSGATGHIIDQVFLQTNYTRPKAKTCSGRVDVVMKEDLGAEPESPVRCFGSQTKTVRTRSTNSTDFHLSAFGDNSSTEDGSAQRCGEEHKHPTQVMYERWNKSNALTIPMLDQKDIVEENPIFNLKRKTGPSHQHHPEYTQSSYLRLRAVEDAFKMSNYFKSERQQLKERMSSKKALPKEQVVTGYDRSYGIQKIFDLHQKKDYRPETLFVAAGIFDRYIASVGLASFPKSEIVALATISMLMAAKLEQPISPSFTRMISLLTAEERQLVTKKKLIDLEARILMAMGFDFNFPGPIQAMERYLRILDYDLNTVIPNMAFQISKFSLNEAKFLDYSPSKIAACACILAINIYEWDAHKNNKSDRQFFKDSAVKGGLVALNLDIWNTEQVFSLTGYSIEDLSPCLFDLSVFIWNNLSPNRLENFDISAIRSAKKFKSQW